jgi:hypothetical protein
MGVRPGDKIRLRRLGYSAGAIFFPSKIADPPELRDYRLTGLFSSSSAILDHAQLHRVPGAIDAGTDIQTQLRINYPDHGPNDIEEDFVISTQDRTTNSVEIIVPPHARYLFVNSPVESFYARAETNVGSLRVEISLVEVGDRRVACLLADGTWKHYPTYTSLPAFVCEWDGVRANRR